VVVILWSKLGSSIASGLGSRQGALTGTQWEFGDAIASSEKRGVPWVVVYHRRDPLMIPVDDPNYDSLRHEYERVKQFLEVEVTGRSLPHGSFVSYKGIPEFRGSVEQTLRKAIKGILKERPSSLDKKPVGTRAGWTGCPFQASGHFLRPKGPSTLAANTSRTKSLGAFGGTVTRSLRSWVHLDRVSRL